MENLYIRNLDRLFKRVYVEEEIGIRNVTENANVSFEAVEENAQNTQNHTDEEANVDGDETYDEECCHPNETVEVALFLEAWKVGDLHQHSFQGNAHDRG